MTSAFPATHKERHHETPASRLTQGWPLKRTTHIERILLIIGGLLLAYPASVCDILGISLIAICLLIQKLCP